MDYDTNTKLAIELSQICNRNGLWYQYKTSNRIITDLSYMNSIYLFSSFLLSQTYSLGPSKLCFYHVYADFDFPSCFDIFPLFLVCLFSFFMIYRCITSLLSCFWHTQLTLACINITRDQLELEHWTLPCINMILWQFFLTTSKKL